MKLSRARARYFYFSKVSLSSWMTFTIIYFYFGYFAGLLPEQGSVSTVAELQETELNNRMQVFINNR